MPSENISNKPSSACHADIYFSDKSLYMCKYGGSSISVTICQIMVLGSMSTDLSDLFVDLSFIHVFKRHALICVSSS